MEIDMKVKKERIFVMVKENICIMMEVIILETGLRGKCKVKENLLMLMEIWFIKVSGKMIIIRGKED